MASAIRQMTGLGGDVRKIARLLQKKAPPGHMLAYINQEEADLLKARGGSGKPHADTGVPSFEPLESNPIYDFETPGTSEPASAPLERSAVAPLDLTSEQSAAPQTSSPFAAYERATLPDTARYFQENQAAGAAPKVDLGQGASASFGDYASAPSGSTYTDENISGSLRDSAARAAAAPAYAPPTQDKDLLGRTEDYFANLSPETKKLLGQTAAGSIPALIGAYTTQQASEQARKAKEEMMARSAPYKAQADEMITKARSGELTPVGQQQLQAVQAQAAQAAQGRGGVAAQQAMTQVEAYRQQLLQGQYDYGLKLANISDQIALGAIKTGLEADRYINAATMDYFNNAIRMFQGQSPQVAGRQPTDTTAPRG